MFVCVCVCAYVCVVCVSMPAHAKPLRLGGLSPQGWRKAVLREHPSENEEEETSPAALSRGRTWVTDAGLHRKVSVLLYLFPEQFVAPEHEFSPPTQKCSLRFSDWLPAEGP